MPLWVRIFLGFEALIWFVYGVHCWLHPGSLAQGAGVGFLSPTGETEIRAMYGGLQAALGVLVASAFVRPSMARVALVTLLFLCAGLAGGRLAGLAMGGGLSGYTVAALVFELGSTLLAAVCLGRVERPVTPA